ncbi:unnamed protein product [Didymodactylos carnosus]|uniref:Uncharacterized protein n=1 Tax=Didymodactylos carnosus TaxID=1234261 RepID=A0A815DTU7_9BILA|nr:unnamed protein product [Didymodactylos carnosus]CAF4128011.1 unnamed protein product [Didymodactylos carnosus]
MFLACPLCESNFQEKVIDNVVSGATRIKRWQWVNINGRAEKKEFEESVDEGIELLKSKVKYFLFHVYIKREQSKYFEQLKSEVTAEKVVIQVDLAETFGLKEQDEIQSAHWNTKTLSIFTAYVWSKSLGFSFTHPSNDVSHDKFVVNSAIEIILNELKTHVPNLKQIDFFSDGAASQFKQRFTFRNLIQIAHEYKIALSWNFFATSHGKGVVDGLGGTVKRLVWSAALADDNCKSAKDFVTLAQQKTKKIIITEITKNAIDNSKLKLENIFKVAKSVPETLKTHSVKVIDNKTLDCRYYSLISTKKIIKYD